LQDRLLSNVLVTSVLKILILLCKRQMKSCRFRGVVPVACWWNWDEYQSFFWGGRTSSL